MKSQLVQELQKPGILNFSLFTTQETFTLLPALLRELLEDEKNDFEKLINKPDQELVFEDFIKTSLLEYLRSLLNHLDAVAALSELRAIISEFRPLFEDFTNEVAYSQPYYEKLCWGAEHLANTADKKRRFELAIKDYQRRGIALSEEKKSELKELNKQLSEIGEKFQHNVVDEQAAFSYRFNDDSVLQEFPNDLLQKIKKSDDDGGGYVVDADPTLLQAVVKYASDSQVRKYFTQQMHQRASHGAYDNRPGALNYVKLMHQKSHILGHKNAGEMLLDGTMAQNPDQVISFSQTLSAKGLEKMKIEIQTLQDYFGLSGLEPRDVAYYSRKYKEEKFNLQEEKLKEYFEFESVLRWLHDFAQNFFGITLKSLDSDTSMPQQRRYEVYQEGELIAYYLLDPFYRKGKRPGAWADILRQRSDTALPIIVNVCNFAENSSGPTLLYMRDVETLFHEFGHALHALLSTSLIPGLGGFSVEWDFVELPSQLLENWVSDGDSLTHLAKHYQTGESLPVEILATLQHLKTYMTGVFVSRQIELGMLDMNLYTAHPAETIEDLDQQILEIVNQYSFFPRGEEYKMYTAFLHIFGGGYEAKYYSYMRADLLQADVFEKIKKDGLFDTQVGADLRDTILAQGTRKPALELFKDFMGREPNPEALMRKFGFL